MIDIDHFKVVNDTYGHDAGDEVLKHISLQLSQTTRQSNVVARIGGEEFAVLLPKTSLPEAVEVAERMRQAVENNRYQLKQQVLNVTISIGVAVVDCELPMAQAYKAADMALYQAKHAGRNRVVASSWRETCPT
jgi:diguanylate cyclase (GGDEF)-like protein